MNPTRLDAKWVAHSIGSNLSGAPSKHCNNASNGVADANPLDAWFTQPNRNHAFSGCASSKHRPNASNLVGFIENESDIAS